MCALPRPPRPAPPNKHSSTTKRQSPEGNLRAFSLSFSRAYLRGLWPSPACVPVHDGGSDAGKLSSSVSSTAPSSALRAFSAFAARRSARAASSAATGPRGVAAGAGANIAFACDIVLAAKSAKFIQAFSRIGLIPDAGGTYWLTKHLGEARAKALALTAHPLPAEDAAAWGLIWKAVDDESLMAEAEALATQFAAGPTRAYALTKQAIHAASTNSLDEQLDAERGFQRQAGQSDDYKEGVKAFLEKRPPNYRKG